MRLASIGIDIFLCSIPITFMVLASLVASLDRKKVGVDDTCDTLNCPPRGHVDVYRFFSLYVSGFGR